MNENEWDDRLEDLFQQAFRLTDEREQALWRRLAAARQTDAHDWTAFARVMLGLQARLKPATGCLFLCARGLAAVR